MLKRLWVDWLFDRLVMYELTVPRPKSALEAVFVRATGAESVIQAISVHSTNPDHNLEFLLDGYLPLPTFLCRVPTCWLPAEKDVSWRFVAGACGCWCWLWC